MRRWRRGTRYAALMAVAYVLVSSVYKVLSDDLAASLARSVDELHQMQHAKGLVFMAVTGLAMFLVNRWGFNRLEAASDELLRRERALLENERRVFAGTMASAVAHDANNVLAVVLADLSDLRQGRLQAAQAEVVAELEQAVRRLVELNRRLVSANKSDLGQEKRALDLRRASREALDSVRSHARVRYCELRFLEAGQGEEQEALVEATPLWIQQVVTNLVLNAAEAAGERGRIEVRLRQEGERACLEVHDNGPGVPVERRAGLFEALTTTKADGNGLGLFSVKACAKAMGGSVEVGGSPLGGACFRVWLPLASSRRIAA